MTLILFITIAVLAWILPLIKLKNVENGLNKYLKNLSVVLIFDVTILCLAYIAASFICENRACSDGLFINSIVAACVFSISWAVMLFFKKQKV